MPDTDFAFSNPPDGLAEKGGSEEEACQNQLRELQTT
jgi:hypothetical protein